MSVESTRKLHWQIQWVWSNVIHAVIRLRTEERITCQLIPLFIFVCTATFVKRLGDFSCFRVSSAFWRIFLTPQYHFYLLYMESCNIYCYIFGRSGVFDVVCIFFNIYEIEHKYMRLTLQSLSGLVIFSTF